MTRRTFFGVISAAFIVPKEVLWIHTPSSVERTAIEELTNQLDEGTFGIPYHYNNYSTGQWLGILRN